MTVAAYNISHPLTGIPKFIVETSDKEPKKALADAVSRLKKKNAELKKEAAKLK